MGAPPGNQNAKGHAGNAAGRKSLYQERQDVEFVSDVWRNEQDVDALERKVLSKKYSGREITMLRLLKGSEKLMLKFMDKLVPDMHVVEGNGVGFMVALTGFEYVKPIEDSQKEVVAPSFSDGLRDAVFTKAQSTGSQIEDAHASRPE